MFLPLTFLSLLIELAAGYPQPLFRAIGHPVTWIGSLIAFLDRRLNRDADSDTWRRILGIGALLTILAMASACGWAVARLFSALPFGIVLTALAASTLIAQRSLAAHVEAVADELQAEGLPAGRRAVSMIVGRDPEGLDEAGVCRAAIESLAENFSDGVVAPAFWLAAGGLPAAAAYKAANTADSMIGHRTPRHAAFGWASARFDDLINLPASRLSALLLLAAAALVPGASPAGAWRAVRRDAARHRSPNAGWPEAAMAGALGLALGGPRSYGGAFVDDGFMGAGGRREATATDIRRALRLFWTADALLVAATGAGALLTMV